MLEAVDVDREARRNQVLTPRFATFSKVLLRENNVTTNEL